MRSARLVSVAIATLAIVAGGALPVRAQDSDDSAQVVLDWNVTALGTAGGAGLPPPVIVLYMGMTHGAMYDAVVSIGGRYQPYLGAIEADPTASKVAAAATAAHGVLAASFPDAAADLQAKLDESLATVPDGPAKDAGIAVGEAAAAAMLAERKDDGRGGENVLTFGTGPGEYRPTPPSEALFGATWLPNVKPFLAESADYYRTAGPYALDSAEYAADFNEVKSLGGAEGSERTDEMNALMAFWLSPIGQWSQVERALATEKGLDIVDAARLFAIANLATADGAIGAWADKYHWMFWRPITAIHEAESDGNPDTEPDPAWAPAAETPPYPDHPSGWNTFAGAHVGALREFFGTDEMAYQIKNPDIPEPRTYTSFTQGLQEGIDLRVWQGLHFRAADVQAAELGLKAAALAAERLAPIED